MFSNVSTLNKEAFMLILVNMWDKWATKATLVKSVRRVGVAHDYLSIEYMQQDKFHRAENCIEQTKPSTSVSVYSPDSIVSPDKRRGSSLYWKSKFNQAMDMINELHEKSIKLDDIPGFMTIQKVKPNLSKTNTRVTQVHGSMKAKRVLTVVEDIKNKKDQKTKEKQDAINKKEEVKEAFILCKVRCICREIKCKAIGWKECSICHNIMRSVCSKVGCRVDGRKPEMILPAASLTHRRPLFDESDNWENEDFSSEESDNDMEIEDEELELEVEDPLALSKCRLIKTWNSINPPVKEEDILGKWYGVVYESKKSSVFFVAKVKVNRIIRYSPSPNRHWRIALKYHVVGE
jgi:hypothetical protein